ncbi:hypothetical protein [Corynebacterium sp. UMB2355A]|uniref:hypothetical protein n=1 Tax=Corynebacterium sp. UMB2355A TaxID=3081222 RepID=UPI0029FF2FC9|nr:hypothetical protein [Corynebacterium sp. UMB2355A]WPJ91826.1 hypothetical protein R0V12_05810 [Corynebacterium sp. UMB2355A]
MKLLNLTPHAVHFLGSGVNSSHGDVILTVPAADTAARVSEAVTPTDALHAEGVVIPTAQVSYTEQVENLPDFCAGTILIVSQLICQALPHRDDLYFPYPVVRNEHNEIIGCRGLARLA